MRLCRSWVAPAPHHSHGTTGVLRPPPAWYVGFPGEQSSGSEEDRVPPALPRASSAEILLRIAVEKPERGWRGSFALPGVTRGCRHPPSASLIPQARVAREGVVVYRSSTRVVLCLTSASPSDSIGCVRGWSCRVLFEGHWPLLVEPLLPKLACHLCCTNR